MAPNRLNQLLESAGHPPLAADLIEKFAAYFNLLQKWNAKTNLTAIRDEEGILRRHFLESILCASALPSGIATLLDFGSGAGFPGIPVALIRPEIHITLAESQNKKAAFLREAVRVLEIQTKIHSARAEELKTRFDCITLRAVDNMQKAIPAAIQLLNPTGHLAILTTREDAESIQALANQSNHLQASQPDPRHPNRDFQWQIQPLSAGTNRILLIANRPK
jgi:16S rRNA (guanine527-N7)-methyltransferase